MIGTVKWNLLLAMFGFIIVFLFAWMGNEWQTAVIRGAMGFFLFFFLTYFIRMVFGVAVKRELHKENDSEPLQENLTNGPDNRPDDADSFAKQTSEMIRSLVHEDEKREKINNE